MTGAWQEPRWIGRVRILVGIGLLGYLGSFFFLSSSEQKTLFYIGVALPSLLLIPDLWRAPIIARDRENKAALSFLVVIVYFALSSLWSDEGNLFHGLKLALSLVCLMLAIHSTGTRLPNAAVAIRQFIMLVGAAAICFYCVVLAIQIDWNGGLPPLLAQRQSFRMISGIGDSNPINDAIYLGVVVLAAWWVFPSSSLRVKSALLVLMATGMALMLLTQSRGPVISLLLTLFLLALTRRHRDDFIVWGCALVVGTVVVFQLDLLPRLTERLDSPNYRLEIWSHALRLIEQHPFFGQGLGDSADIPVLGERRFFIVNHSHSSVLESFRIGGFVGGAALFLMLFFNARIAASRNDERQFFLFWLLFGLLCLSTNGRLPVIRPSVEWFALWIPMLMAAMVPPVGKSPPASGN